MSAKTVTRSLLCLSAVASALPVFNPAAQAGADAINGFPPTSFNQFTPSSFSPATSLTESGSPFVVDKSEANSLLSLLPGQNSPFNGEGTIVNSESTQSEESGFFGGLM